MRTKAFAYSLIGLLALAGAGCIDHEGQLALFLTNSANENSLGAKQVSIEVVGVEILDTESGEFVTLAAGSQIYELVGLNESASLLAVADQLRSGRYTQVRLRLSEANSRIINAAGRQRALQIDPANVTVPAVFEISDNGSTSVTLGIDLESSLTLKANGSWVLRPVIRQDS